MAFHLHLCTVYIYISTRPATGLKTFILQHLSSSLSLYRWIPPHVAVLVFYPFFRSSNWVYSSSRKLRSFRLQPLVDKTVGTGHKLLTNKSRNTFFKSTFFFLSFFLIAGCQDSLRLYTIGENLNGPGRPKIHQTGFVATPTIFIICCTSSKGWKLLRWKREQCVSLLFLFHEGIDGQLLEKRCIRIADGI